jgi:hypothetical protein
MLVFELHSLKWSEISAAARCSQRSASPAIPGSAQNCMLLAAGKMMRARDNKKRSSLPPPLSDFSMVYPFDCIRVTRTAWQIQIKISRNACLFLAGGQPGCSRSRVVCRSKRQPGVGFRYPHGSGCDCSVRRRRRSVVRDHLVSNSFRAECGSSESGANAYLALGLRVIAPRVLHALVFEPVGPIACNIRRNMMTAPAWPQSN